VLDAVLHAAWMVVYCRRVDQEKRGLGDVGPILGELDWVTELTRLREEIYAATQLRHGRP
jgi:hypothetical protein